MHSLYSTFWRPSESFYNERAISQQRDQSQNLYTRPMPPQHFKGHSIILLFICAVREIMSCFASSEDGGNKWRGHVLSIASGLGFIDEIAECAALLLYGALSTSYVRGQLTFPIYFRPGDDAEKNSQKYLANTYSRERETVLTVFEGCNK